jgi:hypothetical protein
MRTIDQYNTGDHIEWFDGQEWRPTTVISRRTEGAVHHVDFLIGERLVTEADGARIRFADA